MTNKFKPNQNQQQKQEENIGALWMRTGITSNEEYLIGRVQINGVKHEIIAFKNKFKDAPNKPDFIIKMQDNRNETNTANNQRRDS